MERQGVNQKTYILFDVDGVLVHGYHAKPELQKCWDENMEQDLGICRAAFKTEFIAGVFVDEVLVGKRDLKDALAEVLPRIGYQGDVQRVIDYWLQHDSNVNHELFPYIKTLKSSGNAALYIATNQEKNRAQYLMNDLSFGQYFSDIYYSGRVGYLKPDPAYYAFIENDLGLASQDRIIFFDDTQAVVDGALEAGWEAHQFDGVDDLFKSETVCRLLAAEGNAAVAGGGQGFVE